MNENFQARNQLGENLKSFRIQKNLSLPELAQLTGIPEKVLTDLELGSTANLPPKPYLRAFMITLAKHYNTEPKTFLNALETDHPEQAPVVPTEKSQDTLASPPKKSLLLMGGLGIAALILFLSLLGNFFKEDPSEISDPSNLIQDSLNIDSPSETEILESLNSLDSAGLNDPVSGPLPNDSTAPNLDSNLKIKSDTAKNPLKSTLLKSDTSKTSTKNKGFTLTITALVDSVWITASGKGEKEVGKNIRKGERFQIQHHDTLYIKTGLVASTKIESRGKIYFPAKRQFKVFYDKYWE